MQPHQTELSNYKKEKQNPDANIRCDRLTTT